MFNSLGIERVELMVHVERRIEDFDVTFKPALTSSGSSEAILKLPNLFRKGNLSIDFGDGENSFYTELFFTESKVSPTTTATHRCFEKFYFYISGLFCNTMAVLKWGNITLKRDGNNI